MGRGSLARTIRLGTVIHTTASITEQQETSNPPLVLGPNRRDTGGSELLVLGLIPIA